MDFNYAIDILGLAIVFAILFSEKRNRITGNSDQKLFRLLLHSIALVFIFDIPAWLIIGKSFRGARELSYVLNSGYYLAQIIYCFLWLIFTDCWNNSKSRALTKRTVLYAIPAVVEVVLIFLNPFNGWIFKIDAQNVYVRGSGYMVNLIPYALYILGAIAVTTITCFKSKSERQRKQSASFLTYMVLPIIGTMLQMFNYGVSLLWPFTVLSLIMIYFNVQQQNAMTIRLEKAYAEQKLTEANVSVMLSQIQPHFLYNSLSVIQVLCDTDPSTASKAVVEFTDFLRGNMDSLKQDKLISFEQELAHTNHYLALEKLRFKDSINIEYDVQATLFRLPTLTLQPIVENAVRYGVTKKDEGGTVKISSFEKDDAFIIQVEDNGRGFDITQKKNVGRTHVGIENVRNRLKDMCAGTLEIVSTLGVGTKVTIIIPKSQEEKQETKSV